MRQTSRLRIDGDELENGVDRTDLVDRFSKHGSNAPVPSRTWSTERATLFARNLFCGSLALAVIASGRVREGRRSAFNSDVVTCIYFHNPDRALFVRCVRWLKKHGYCFISAKQLADFQYRRTSVPRGAVWLSFDDGCRELLYSVVPIAREHKIPITLFIPSGIIEGDGILPWLHNGASGPARTALIERGVRDCMTVSELAEIARYPEVIIGSHTVNHPVTVGLPEEEARFELVESKRALEAWTCRPVECFAYPEGRFDGRESRLLDEAGYEMAVTTEATFNTQQKNPYLIPRLHVADHISFLEAVCNMAGVWRPAIEPIIGFLQRWSTGFDRFRRALHNPTDASGSF